MTREEAIFILERDNPNNIAIRSGFESLYDERKEAFSMAIKALEQEPRKGHWILTDVEGDRVWHCHCSECGKDPQDYIGGSENWWLIKSKLPEFCPSCGSDNREVVEK